MPLPTHLPLTTSLTLYPLLLRLVTGPSPTPAQYTAALKATSTIHSLLITTLALTFLHRQRSQWPPSSPTSSTPSLTQKNVFENGKRRYLDDTYNPTITTRSAFGNAIAAFECGYLLQDTFALLLKARLFRDTKSKGSSPDKTLLLHHLTLSALLLYYQSYTTSSPSRESGIYIIIQFLLMNASTPLLNLKWYLRTYLPSQKRAILVSDILFAITFFAARIGLVWSVLWDYGRWHGMGAWEVYWRGLRVPCQLGTGALVGVNLGWWVVMVRNLLVRVRKAT